MELTDNDPDLPVPSLEALVACTLALMTAWAARCADARGNHLGQRDLGQRSLLASKIASNLFVIQSHPCASPVFRQVMASAYPRWLALAHATHDASAPTLDLSRHPALH